MFAVTMGTMGVSEPICAVTMGKMGVLEPRYICAVTMGTIGVSEPIYDYNVQLPWERCECQGRLVCF